MSTFEQVAQMLADYKSIDVSTITPDTTFASIGVDSLDMAELAMNMEDEMGVTIEVNEDMKTVGSIVEAIDAAK
ncbi:MAG: phosphopantetheine-binding protein [Clostridia bacterium]|nr:phosphopantetheine-binding protein [Clostridia bacterium]